MWRVLIRPPFDVIDPEILVRWKDLFPVAGILVCLLEFGYPFFVWNTRTRKVWLFGICVMHVAIAVAMGMYLFSLVMIVLNVAAFGPGLFRRQAETPRYSLRLLPRKVRKAACCVLELLPTEAVTIIRPKRECGRQASRIST
jgi:hypothetical protein